MNYSFNKKQDLIPKKSAEQDFKQMDRLSNIYYQPLSFGKSWQEHQSWGTIVNSDNNLPSSVKMYTFADAQKVSLLLEDKSNENLEVPLNETEKGVFEAVLPPGFLKDGDRYAFEITKSDGTVELVKDPYSFKQPQLLGYSEAYDQNKYNWLFDDSYEKISRHGASDDSVLSVNDAIIYEMNLATSIPPEYSDEDTDRMFKNIAQLGYNTVQFMPLENTYSFNWGYDGVDKFAVSEFLGGPDRAKKIIDLAHKNNLNVVIDMVPNHIGPDGAALHRSGPYISGETAWGDAFNYKDEKVRDYMVNAALNWVNNYHADGIRFDMTKAMNDDTMMQQLAAELNFHNPDVFLIAEDARSGIEVWGDFYRENHWQPHDMRVVNPLKKEETGENLSEEEHIKAVDKIRNGAVPLSRLGFDSEWDFYFYHVLKNVAYGNYDLDALERACIDSQSRIKYDTNHDETGNMDGTRLVAKYMVPLLKLNDGIILDEGDNKRIEGYIKFEQSNGSNPSYESVRDMVYAQKTQLTSMELALLAQTGALDKYEGDYPAFQKEVLDAFGIRRDFGLSVDIIKQAFDDALRVNRMCSAIKYFSPGPIMTFQGDERVDLTNFRFFREFQSVDDEFYLYLQKGYPYGRHAYEASIPGKIDYSPEGLEVMEKFERLTSDLNKFMAQNKASTKGQIDTSKTVKHYANPTIAMYSKSLDGKNETYMITNLANSSYPKYDMAFPRGKWVEVINTNDKKYGGDGFCVNRKPVVSEYDGELVDIRIPEKSTLIFKKIDD